MKKSLILTSMLALGTSALALDVNGFVGVGVGGAWSSYDAKFSAAGLTVTESDSDSSTLGILKGGVILDNAHRTSLVYAPVLYKNADIDNYLFAYDYLIPVNDDSRVSLGLHIGTTSFDGKKDLEGLKDTSFSYGAQVGYIHDITSNVELEIGAMYTRHDIQANTTKTISGVSGNFEVKVKDTASAFVGINYKF